MHRLGSFGFVGEATVAEVCYLFATSLQPVRSIFSCSQFVVFLESAGDGMQHGIECLDKFSGVLVLFVGDASAS